MKIVERITRQTVLGYSKDFRQTHVRHEVLFTDSTTGVLYSTDTTDEKGYTWAGNLTEDAPVVEIPNMDVRK